MRASIQKRDSHVSYSARTQNNILIVFSAAKGEAFTLGEEIEVDLPSLVATQQLVRLRDGATVEIRIRDNDIHDLDLPANHGNSRTPSLERMRRV